MQRVSLRFGSVRCLVAVSVLLLLSLSLGVAQQSDPGLQQAAGLEWSLVHGGGGFASPKGTTANSLLSVAFGSGTYVAVGTDGTIVRSTDGERWQEAVDNPASSTLWDVAWGGGWFVAVGFDTIVRSVDGDRWVEASDAWASDLPKLFGVASDGNRFVAVGLSGEIVFSADGDRWSHVGDSATEAYLSGVAWGGGYFVAVGAQGTVLRSSDGDRWERASDTATSAGAPGCCLGRRSVRRGRSPGNHRTEQRRRSLGGGGWRRCFRSVGGCRLERRGGSSWSDSTRSCTATTARTGIR